MALGIKGRLTLLRFTSSTTDISGYYDHGSGGNMLYMSNRSHFNTASLEGFKNHNDPAICLMILDVTGT